MPDRISKIVRVRALAYMCMLACVYACVCVCMRV